MTEEKNQKIKEVNVTTNALSTVFEIGINNSPVVVMLDTGATITVGNDELHKMLDEPELVAWEEGEILLANNAVVKA